MRRLTTWIFILAATVSVSAQPSKMVKVGGGPDLDEETKNWPSIRAVATASDAEKTAAIDAMIRDLAAKDLFAGAVLVEKNGKPLFRKAYGLADRELNVPNTPETKFNLGSINKAFTGAVIRQLIAEGKLRDDETLREALPETKVASADKITIGQLLEHKSGMGDFFGERWRSYPKNLLRSNADYLPLFEDKPLDFQPGQGQRYSNAGYVMLGLVIEKVTGMSYYDAVRTRVFDKAGMSDSSSYALDEVVANRAHGYTRAFSKAGEPLRSNFYTLPARGSAAGGGYSTVDDLARFASMVRKKQREQGEGGGGMGIAGGSPGVNSALEMGPDFTIAVLANLDPPSAEYVAMQIRKLFASSNEDK